MAHDAKLLSRKAIADIANLIGATLPNNLPLNSQSHNLVAKNGKKIIVRSTITQGEERRLLRFNLPIYKNGSSAKDLSDYVVCAGYDTEGNLIHTLVIPSHALPTWNTTIGMSLSRKKNTRSNDWVKYSVTKDELKTMFN